MYCHQGFLIRTEISGIMCLESSDMIGRVQRWKDRSRYAGNIKNMGIRPLPIPYSMVKEAAFVEVARTAMSWPNNIVTILLDFCFVSGSVRESASEVLSMVA